MEPTIEEVDPNALLNHHDNWRIHPEHQRQIMTGALLDLGWTQPVTVSRRTGTIVDGHLRVFLAKANGQRVPVAWVDLNEIEERKALASTDALTGLADVDWQKVMDNLSAFGAEDTNEEMAGLFDEMFTDASRAIDDARKLEEQGSTGFGAIKKTFRERKVLIKAIYPLTEDAETVEAALSATGLKNRASAMLELARAYIELHQLQLDGDDDDQAAEQLHAGPEAQLEAQMLAAVGS
jgi:hypothetical protein